MQCLASPQVVDWNNDGKKDLLTGDWAGYIRVYPNSGTDADPSFGAFAYVYSGGAPFAAAGYGGVGLSTPEVVDWNNDGRKDLLCGGYAGMVQLLLNTAATSNDTPSFSESTFVIAAGTAISAGPRSTVVVCDWNNDGRKDLLVGDGGGYGIRFYANCGTDNSPLFSGYSIVQAAGANISHATSAGFDVADWNNDGEHDLLVGAYDGTVTCYLGIRRILISVATNVSETAGIITGQVSLISAPSLDLLVSLSTSNSNPGEVTVPATVTIAAGQTGAQFTAAINDDRYPDGTQVAVVTASAAGYAAGVVRISVSDSETAVLSVALPVSTVEGAGVLVNQGRVTTGTAVGANTVVELGSTDQTEISVPGTVVIQSGQTSALFNITVIDDSLIDGVQVAGVDARVVNWTTGSATMSVADNESTNLTVSILSRFDEGGGVVASAGSVTIDGTLAADLVVSLVSSDTSELSLPATVTVPAGQTAVFFSVTVTDDGLADGQQQVTVTASAAGFLAGAVNTVVADREVSQLEMSPVPSSPAADVPFALTVRAVDIAGSNAAYAGTVNFSAAGDGGPLPVAPSVSGSFVRGAWSGDVAINGLGSNVRLVASDGIGHSVTSALFNVVPGPVDRLVWEPVASPRMLTAPFDATITVRDANDYTATGFTGPADLEAWSGTGPQKTVGSGLLSWSFPLYTWYHDARTQVIYPASDLACTGMITSLALEVVGTPAQTMNNWTIRIKHTTLDSYPASPQWETDGWTVAYQNNETISSPGWVTFMFSTPFMFNGTDNLMMDFSFNNSSYTLSGTVRAGDVGVKRSVIGWSDSAAGDPLAWPGPSSKAASPNSYVPNIRLGLGTRVAVSPGVAGVFADGLWTGALRVAGTGTAVRIWAHDGNGHWGCTTPFDVLDPPLAVSGISMLDSGRLHLEFGSVSGRWYTVRWKTNLLDPVWQTLPACSNLFSTGGICDIVHTNLHDTGFYRIIQEPL